MAQTRGEKWGCAERAVPVAEHRLEDEHREGVWRAPPHALDCERKVDRRHRIVPDAHFGAHKICLRVQRTPQERWFWRTRQRCNAFLGGLDEWRGGFPTGTHEYQPARSLW